MFDMHGITNNSFRFRGRRANLGRSARLGGRGPQPPSVFLCLSAPSDIRHQCEQNANVGRLFADISAAVNALWPKKFVDASDASSTFTTHCSIQVSTRSVWTPQKCAVITVPYDAHRFGCYNLKQPVSSDTPERP